MLRSSSAFAAIALVAGAVCAEHYTYQTPIPPGVASPDQVESRLGTLTFDCGYPDDATAQILWDNLDFQRAVQSYMLALPIVNQKGNLDAIAAAGPLNQTVPIWEALVDPRTTNPSTWSTRPIAPSGRC